MKTYQITLNGANLAVTEQGQIFQNGQELKQYRKRTNVSGQYYLLVKINGKPYHAHRVAMGAYSGGQILSGLYVDHINGIKSDNRKANLQWVSPSENRKNIVHCGQAGMPLCSRFSFNGGDFKSWRDVADAFSLQYGNFCFWVKAHRQELSEKPLTYKNRTGNAVTIEHK